MSVEWRQIVIIGKLQVLPSAMRLALLDESPQMSQILGGRKDQFECTGGRKALDLSLYG